MLRILLLVFLLFGSVQPVCAEPTTFQEFSVDLPKGWDGEEKMGFSSGDRNEYMLILGKKDQEGERYLATIAIYLLPNKPGKDAHESAKLLAASQADASEPVQEGAFWVFTGDPRDNILKGIAQTKVAADKDNLLIIISKDHTENEAPKILQSLKPATSRTKTLLP